MSQSHGSKQQLHYFYSCVEFCGAQQTAAGRWNVGGTGRLLRFLAGQRTACWRGTGAQTGRRERLHADVWRRSSDWPSRFVYELALSNTVHSPCTTARAVHFYKQNVQASDERAAVVLRSRVASTYKRIGAGASSITVAAKKKEIQARNKAAYIDRKQQQQVAVKANKLFVARPQVMV